MKYLLLSRSLNEAFITCEACFDNLKDEQGYEASELSDNEIRIAASSARERREKDLDFVDECEICDHKLVNG